MLRVCILLMAGLLLAGLLAAQEEIEVVIRCRGGARDGRVPVTLIDAERAGLPPEFVLHIDEEPAWVAPGALRRLVLGHDDAAWRLVADLGPVQADVDALPPTASLPDGSDLAAKAAAQARAPSGQSGPASAMEEEASESPPEQDLDQQARPRPSSSIAWVLDGSDPVLVVYVGDLAPGPVLHDGRQLLVQASDGNYAVLRVGQDLEIGDELLLYPVDKP